MFPVRSIRPFASIAVLALLAAASTGAKEEKAAPAPAAPIRVAIMPVVNSSPDLGATKIMEDMIRERIMAASTQKAHFLHPTDTERILITHDALDRSDRLTDRWSKRGTLDTTAVMGLDSLLQADAILFVKINEWESNRVNVIGRGESNTTVGLQFALYDIKTCKQTWHKEPREQRFAQEIDVSSGSVTYDETGYIQSRNVTDPPRFEDVTSDLIRSAFKKFPEK
jgi:hypothetical protein